MDRGRITGTLAILVSETSKLIHAYSTAQAPVSFSSDPINAPPALFMIPYLFHPLEHVRLDSLRALTTIVTHPSATGNDNIRFPALLLGLHLLRQNPTIIA